MTVIFSDNFDRANSTNAPGSPQLGGPYTVRAGTWGINNNELYASASLAASVITVPAPTDLEISAFISTTATAGTGNPGLVARWVSQSNFIFVWANSGRWAIGRRVGTTAHLLAEGKPYKGLGPGMGEHVRLVLKGTDIRLYVDGLLTATAESPNPEGTAAGFLMNSGVAGRFNDAIIDDAPVFSDIPDSMLYEEIFTTSPFETQREALVYKGRDTSLLDIGGLA